MAFRPPSPRTLFALGLALLLAAVLVAVFVYGHETRHQTAPATTAATTTQPAPPAVTVPQPFAVNGATTVGLSAFSTSVTWTTPHPATARVTWGPAGLTPVLWQNETVAASSHSVTLEGLLPVTAYDVQIDAAGPDGETASGSLSFTTPPAAPQTAAGTANGVLLADGSPFFPLIVWQDCPDQWAPNLAQGINLFAGNPCTGLPSLLTALQGHALAVGTTDDPSTAGPGLIGWFYPDEADGRGLTAASMPNPAGAGVSFLTLTGHFYSGSAPLPAGRGIYPALIARADVVGFDLYPLQELCNPAALDQVFDAQQQLVALAPGKPTFQWIEVRTMRCPSIAVTNADIRAESWLAIAGGANGLGFFPSDWGVNVGAAIRGIASRIAELEPALVQPVLPVTVDPAASPVRASARELNGALYVIAVNGSDAPASVTLGEPDLGDRTLVVLGEDRQVTAAGGAITDVLPPLAVRIYVAAPM
jgi:hypothetical protein